MKSARPALALAFTVGATLLAAGQRPAAPDARVVRFEPGSGAAVTASAGERLLLQWGNLSSDAILVGFGRVPPAGQHEVTPHADTTYTLISGDGPSVRFHSVFVTVDGARGVDEDETPGLNRYVNTLKATIAGKTYTALVQGVADLLQDKCGYSVRGDHLPSQPYYTVYTNLAVAGPSSSACFSRPAGFDPAKRVVRTSVLVRLTPEAPQRTHVEVGALASWRYAQEKTWRDFGDHGAYQHKISTELRTRMEALQ